jgi:hypothetical protein
MMASQGPVNNINRTQFNSGVGNGISNDPTREQSKEASGSQGRIVSNRRFTSGNRQNVLNESSELSSQMHLSFRPTLAVSPVSPNEEKEEGQEEPVEPPQPLTKVQKL